MANSKITIVWQSVPKENDILTFSESLYGNTISETFKSKRLGNYQVTLPNEAGNTYRMTISDTVDISTVGASYKIPGGDYQKTPLEILPITPDQGTITFEIVSEERVTIYDISTGQNINWLYGSFELVEGASGFYSGFVSENYSSAFNLDYNASNLYTVTYTNDVFGTGTGMVTIQAKFSGAFFVAGINTSGAIVTIENGATLFNITDIAFTNATNKPCEKVTVNVTTNTLAVKVINPVVLNPNTLNPFSFEWSRSNTIYLVLEDVNGNQATQTVVLPSLLNASNFKLQINNSPIGATVIVANINTWILVLQYSLNGVDWQVSNTFSGLSAGAYTLYVKDNLGCSFGIPFEVDAFGIYIPYFYISKANSIRFAKRIDWDDVYSYKNDENTLSCEATVLLPYQETQQFQSSDLITTQFKSNYSSNIATVLKSDLTEVDIPVLKKTNNIGNKDKRDALIYSLVAGKTGLYFLSGNTYDYDTNAITGTYALYGSLPNWAKVGGYFSHENFWHKIEDIIFDETKNAEVLVFSGYYAGGANPATLIVSTIFNIEEYEVYEFSIDMADYVNEKIRVQLENTDDNFYKTTHLSELISVREKHKNLLEIRYKNGSNTDVFYATGIEHKIRMPYFSFNGKIEENSETYKTDTNAILLNADLYEGDEIVFEPTTKEMMRKLTQALSHEFVFINNVGYVKNGSFNIEGALEETNLYVVTATMIKTGNVYNSQSGEDFIFVSDNVEVPGIITTENGFLSY